MNKKETTRILAILTAVWSNEQVDDAKVTAYQLALEDVSYESAQQAVKTLLRSAKFFPKPSEILELIVDVALPQKSSGECWEIVQKQIRSHGYNSWDSVDFGDDAILTAVKAVGWRRLCLDEDQKFIRRDFDDALKVAQERQRKDLQAGVIPLDAVAAPNLTALPRAS